MSDTYTTYGHVRGQCGHAHKTIEAAVRCLERDRAGCAGQGGYSDRQVCVVDDDGYLADMAGSTIWPSHGRSCGAERFFRD